MKYPATYLDAGTVSSRWSDVDRIVVAGQRTISYSKMASRN